MSNIEELTQLTFEDKLNMVYPYVKKYGLSKKEVMALLSRLDRCCGKDSSTKLCRMIEWSKDNNHSEEQIAMNIAHDLGGADSPGFSPRSSSY